MVIFEFGVLVILLFLVILGLLILDVCFGFNCVILGFLTLAFCL